MKKKLKKNLQKNAIADIRDYVTRDFKLVHMFLKKSNGLGVSHYNWSKVLTMKYKSLDCVQGLVAKYQIMKTTILLFAVIFGFITPTYSQLKRHLETDTRSEQFQNKKNNDFRIYKFDKFGDFLSNREPDILDMSPTRPAPGSSQRKYIQQNNMPCFHPKSGDKMPCFEPTGTFQIRVFKPTDTIWGILW